MNIKDEILTTKSIRSGVWEGDERIGHVMLLDYDDHAKDQVLSKVDGLPGVTAVFESSPRSFHVWNLQVHGLEKTVCRMVLQREDPNHVRMGIVNGRWRLRIGPKTHDNREYRSAPELVTVGATESDAPQSAPHMDILTAMHDVPRPPTEFEWVGETAGVDTYATMTDKLKKKWREWSDE